MAYVVIASFYEDYGLLGVYDTLEKAKAAMHEFVAKTGRIVTLSSPNEQDNPLRFSVGDEKSIYNYYGDFEISAVETNRTYEGNMDYVLAD